jgi:hypothetical protein
MAVTRVLVRAALGVIAIAGVAACGDEKPAPPGPTLPDVDASAYSVVIEELAPPSNPDEPPTLFVVAIGEPISLDTQVAVIETMGDGFNVTFVDEAEVAIDGAADGKPPLDGGLLIAIGTIPAEPPYTVRLEAYHSIDEVDARLVTLAWRDDQWKISNSEPVDSEAFVNEAFVSDDG